jgi:hypothetical protein
MLRDRFTLSYEVIIYVAVSMEVYIRLRPLRSILRGCRSACSPFLMRKVLKNYCQPISLYLICISEFLASYSFLATLLILFLTASFRNL